jgi:lipopolysaccharide transport system ATP-binding protein
VLPGRDVEIDAPQKLHVERTDRDGRSWCETLIRRVGVRDAGGGHPDVVVGGYPVEIVVDITEPLPMMECRLTILNSLGQPITTLDSEMTAPTGVRDGSSGPRIVCSIASLPLLPGRYRIDVLLKARRQIQDGLHAAAFFGVEPGILADRPLPTAGLDGDFVLVHAWSFPT